MHNREQLLKDTEYVVEATYHETFSFWKEYSKENRNWSSVAFIPPSKNWPCFEWEQIAPGYHVVVGEFHGFPVNISCWWWKIDGVLVMFYEAVSRVVDHDMVDEWLLNNCVKKDGSSLAKTNADNFHHLIDFIRAKNERKTDSTK
jgi:hypothetical protein